MLPRVLEPEVMDTPEEARDYDAMDHAAVNRAFVADLLAFRPALAGYVLDVGTGTAQIPIELCRATPAVTVIAIDAAAEMLKLARANIAAAGMADRVRVAAMDAKRMPHLDEDFRAVISNSIVHHIPEPRAVFAEMVRVCRPGGVLFVRDLLRPDDEPTLTHLVNTYAAGANHHQRTMFANSLRAALTLDEVRDIVAGLRYDPDTVRPTSDRHWTWAATR